MGRIYTAGFQRVAVTATQDLVSLLATSAVPIKLHAVYLGQSSDVGDAQDENLAIRIRSGMTTVGSGGGTMTPGAVDRRTNLTAATAVARINDTTAATGGTIIEHHEEMFNVRAGWVWLPTPAMQITCDISTRIAINLPVAPADSLTMSCTVYFEEL